MNYFGTPSVFTPPSFLGLENCHVFVTGASGTLGAAVVKQLLENGCNVTGFYDKPFNASTMSAQLSVFGNAANEESVALAFKASVKRYETPKVLILSLGETTSRHPPLWETEVEQLSGVYSSHSRSIILAVKYFLLAVKTAQEGSGEELSNVSIVFTRPRLDEKAQERHLDGLHPALEERIRADMTQINSKARINTVTFRSNTPPANVARCVTFLASERAAGYITGQNIGVSADTYESSSTHNLTTSPRASEVPSAFSSLLGTKVQPRKPRRMRICITVDFDAISGYLGTGHTPHNTLSDYSAGLFSANAGVGRLLKLFQKHGISKKVTWFIPGHSMESFPNQAKAIVDSGAEIGLHGYSHEGAYAMTVQQERDVLEKCIKLATDLCSGIRPVGFRAPLYQIRETTINLLHEHGFLYDTSMNAHDSLPYFLPSPFPPHGLHIPDYTKEASTWMKPYVAPPQPAVGSAEADAALVEIPASWYTEDMTPLGYYPYSSASEGYVSVDVVEAMWLNRFDWLWENECWLDEGEGAYYGSIFPLIWHPESAGRSHVIGMLDRFLSKLTKRAKEAGDGEITFETMQSTASSFRRRSA